MADSSTTQRFGASMPSYVGGPLVNDSEDLQLQAMMLDDSDDYESHSCSDDDEDYDYDNYGYEDEDLELEDVED